MPEPVRKRIEAEALARTAREMLLKAVALNREAADLEDEQVAARSARLDLRETRRVAGVDVALGERESA